jgi:hypothetical protein
VSTPAARSSTPSTTASTTADVTVTVRIAGGKILSGVQTVKVRAGQTVQLAGTSDVADSLHVHGYDKTLELQPGKTATVAFTGDVKGVFEIETHESEKLVAKLVVS